MIKMMGEYDAVSGRGGCGPRVEVAPGKYNREREWIPEDMAADPDLKRVKSQRDWKKLRCHHDFEYWAATCVRIKDKESGQDIWFRLNKPQRRVTAMMEEKRRGGEPIRLIMLKARQWGGSTLIQVYMAWMQIMRKSNWHSLICSHVKDTSTHIRGMYSKLLANYPKDLWPGGTGTKAYLKPYEEARNTREINGRGCRVTIATSENPEAIRGGDYAMAHLSEVAFWADTPQRRPKDFIRAVCGAIAYAPDTLIAMESTANGVGNYFHSEWVRAERGESDKMTVFVPWYEIEKNRLRVRDAEALRVKMDSYCLKLLEMGLDMEQINWYMTKRKEYTTAEMMQAEYPTTPEEAFTNTGCNVFGVEQVARLRKGCRPAEERGELSGNALTGPESTENLRFMADSTGNLEIWERPDEGDRKSERYVVAVDIGGRSPGSDYSVIAVLDCEPCDGSGKPTVVAQWRGHEDHDVVAWKSVALAKWYNNALLVVESNTLETDNTGGDPAELILNVVWNHYTHLYYRTPDDGSAGRAKPGFHTNRQTKTTAISRLIAALRDDEYVERDARACDELATYEQQPNGSMGARAGCHDDIVMTRAIALTTASWRRTGDPEAWRIRCGARW